MREHPSLVNVNIGPFPNVDVVADAHHLPYADASVDAIFCEAVLEHLAQPHEAVKEMFRVLPARGLGVRQHALHAGVPRLPQSLSKLHAERP